ALPILVELVYRSGLQGFVVDTQLDAARRAKQVGLAFAVGSRLHRPLDFLDAGDITGSACAAVHSGHQISRRLPALQIQGDVDGTLVYFKERMDLLGTESHAGLQTLRRQCIDGMG